MRRQPFFNTWAAAYEARLALARGSLGRDDVWLMFGRPRSVPAQFDPNMNLPSPSR
jgi:hypothetical protein